MFVVITARDIAANSRRPRTSDVLCLPLDYLNGWLFAVNTKQVKAGIRDCVVRYQREGYMVLAEAFQVDKGYGERLKVSLLLKTA